MIDTSNAFITLDFTMGHKIKKGLFSFLFIVLLLPFIQQNLPFIKSGQLAGFADYAKNIEFSREKWFDGSYQQEKNKYYNDNTGFRPDMVRLNNQIEFSLFKKMAGGVVLGHNNFLFHDSYIDAYNGVDFAGKKVILERLLKLKAISDTLGRLGKTFLLVYAPNKAFLYPQNIPEPYDHQKKEKNNLEVYKQIGDSIGLKQIDFNSWFISIKDTCRELLIAKQGIHWTIYGAYIAGDSLVKCIENIRNIHMPHPVLSRIIHTHSPNAADVDIKELTNLIFPLAEETFSYPDFKYTDDTSKTRPRLIFIGDSFVFNMINNKILQNTSSDWQFWFYFGVLLNSKNEQVTKENTLIKNYDWKSEINKTDCIVMLYSSTNLTHLGDGFIEQAYDHYYPLQ